MSEHLPTPYYQHAGMTIFNCDCREILPHLAPVDLVLTDPPYSVSVAGSAHVGLPGRGTRSLDFFAGDDDWCAMRAIVREAVSLALDCLVPTGSLYTWCGHRQFGDIVEICESRGMSTRPFFWIKTCPAPAPPNAGWASGAEMGVYAYPVGRTWNLPPGLHPNVIKSDAFRHGNPEKLPHPTQKPIRVLVPSIRASSSPDDTILDPFMGSGTTLRAAKDMGRKAIGIDVCEKYCEIAAKRLAQEVLPFGDPR